MTIAITGATGQLGRIVIDKLKQKVAASDIVALVRTPEKAQSLGVSVRAADYAQPDTLDAALAGIDSLLLISSSEVGQRVAQHANVIAAAKKAGVKHIVYTSLLHADVSPLNLAGEHLATETAIKASGLSYTIMRNGWYTENYTGSVGAALANGAFIGSAGEGRISSASREDFAEAAVAILSSAGHVNVTYELAGDTAWTLKDLADELSRQTGKDIAYHNLPEAEYAAALHSFGLPAELADAIASWDVGASQGALFDAGGELSRLIGRPTTPLATSVEQALKAS